MSSNTVCKQPKYDYGDRKGANLTLQDLNVCKDAISCYTRTRNYNVSAERINQAQRQKNADELAELGRAWQLRKDAHLADNLRRENEHRTFLTNELKATPKTGGVCWSYNVDNRCKEVYGGNWTTNGACHNEGGVYTYCRRTNIDADFDAWKKNNIKDFTEIEPSLDPNITQALRAKYQLVHKVGDSYQARPTIDQQETLQCCVNFMGLVGNVQAEDIRQSCDQKITQTIQTITSGAAPGAAAAPEAPGPSPVASSTGDTTPAPINVDSSGPVQVEYQTDRPPQIIEKPVEKQVVQIESTPDETDYVLFGLLSSLGSLFSVVMLIVIIYLVNRNRSQA